MSKEPAQTEEEIKAAFDSAEETEEKTEETEEKTEETEDKTEDKTDDKTDDKPTALDGNIKPSARLQVVDKDGDVDWEQSFEKASTAHQELSKKLGGRARPATAEDYEWATEDGVEVDEAATSRILKKAFELDFSVDQVNGLKEYLDEESAIKAEQISADAAGIVTEGLQKAWGNDFADNIVQAQSAAKELKLDMNDPTVGNNLQLIELLARLGPKLVEDSTITKTPAEGAVSQDEFDKITAPIEVKGEMLTISDAGHPYWSEENQKIVNAFYAQ